MPRLCRTLGVSRSGYYAWLNREDSDRDRHDAVLKEGIRELHQGYRRAYGAPRVHMALRRSGLVCSRRRINRLMREMGIKPSTAGLYQWRPGSHAFFSSTGNQLAHMESPAGPGQQWAGDFTYIKTRVGFLYFAVVLDLFSRKIVGWSFSKTRNALLTGSALKMALSRERIVAGCLFHSDQGIEYAAHDYRDLLEAAGMTRSMSRKGNPLDNATVESFFHTMKAELVHQQTFDTDIEAVARIVEYVEFYNRDRLHSGLGYQAPGRYERLCA